MSDHKILELNFLAPSIYELIIERNGLEFTPGDCVSIKKSPKVLRPYSIASGTADDHLRFLIRQMEGGEVSAHLPLLGKGEAIELTPPFGWFRPGQSDPNEEAVFIATGTGIAPFISFMNSFDKKVTCLYGVKHSSDILDFDFLNENSELFIATSRERSDHFHGRVSELIKSLEIDPVKHYYLCGLDAMIDEVSDWLESVGVDFANIHREVFFHAES